MSFSSMSRKRPSSGPRIGPNVHVDVDGGGQVVGVEFLYPRTHGVELGQVKERYGIDLEIPFSFAA